MMVGAPILLSLLEGCVSIKVFSSSIENNIIKVPLSSVSPEEKLKIIRPDNLDYDILLSRLPDNSFQAMLMKCTHLENPLVADSKGIVCSLHGSTFNLNGEVTYGPALRNLKMYTVKNDNQYIYIYLT